MLGGHKRVFSFFFGEYCCYPTLVMGKRSTASRTKFQTSIVGSKNSVPNMTLVDSKCSPMSYCEAKENDANEIGKAAISTAARPLLPSKSSNTARATIISGTTISLRIMQSTASKGGIRSIFSWRCIQHPIATRETGDTQSPSQPNKSHAHPSPVTYFEELGLKYLGPILVSERKNPTAMAHRTGLCRSAFPILDHILFCANMVAYECSGVGAVSISTGRETCPPGDSSSAWLASFVLSSSTVL